MTDDDSESPGERERRAIEAVRRADEEKVRSTARLYRFVTGWIAIALGITSLCQIDVRILSDPVWRCLLAGPAMTGMFIALFCLPGFIVAPVLTAFAGWYSLLRCVSATLPAAGISRPVAYGHAALAIVVFLFGFLGTFPFHPP